MIVQIPCWSSPASVLFSHRTLPNQLSTQSGLSMTIPSPFDGLLKSLALVETTSSNRLFEQRKLSLSPTQESSIRTVLKVFPSQFLMLRLWTFLKSRKGNIQLWTFSKKTPKQFLMVCSSNVTPLTPTL